MNLLADHGELGDRKVVFVFDRDLLGGGQLRDEGLELRHQLRVTHDRVRKLPPARHGGRVRPAANTGDDRSTEAILVHDHAGTVGDLDLEDDASPAACPSSDLQACLVLCGVVQRGHHARRQVEHALLRREPLLAGELAVAR